MPRKRMAFLNTSGHTIRVSIGSKAERSVENGAMIVPSECSPEEIRSDMQKFIAEYNLKHDTKVTSKTRI